jgi:hypothetical protein
MVNSTTIAGNLIKGGVRFLHNFGTANTFLGANAGNLSTTGTGRNSALGFSALQNNSTGISNTAVGAGALSANTIGTYNTAVGESSLVFNTTGYANTGLGAGALLGNTTGFYNTGAGTNALRLNTTGSYNTAAGESALYSNTTGFDNTATGVNALWSNTGGSNNTATGMKALESNSVGSDNTATGIYALQNTVAGFSNTATGSGALQANHDGNYNTASGARALFSNIGYLNTGSYNTASGAAALYSNTTGTYNTASGADALSYNTTGSNNTAIGASALSFNTTGSNNTAIGYAADVSPTLTLTNATAIGAFARVNASNKVRIGDLFVEVIEGEVPYTYTSDQNQKENFQPVAGEEVLAKLRGLKLTSWNYIGHDPEKFRHYGPMAQDFFAAFGHDAVGTIGTPTTITSGDLDGILMIAVQALEKRTVEQEKQIADLKAELEQIKAQRVGGEVAAKMSIGH